MVDRPPAFWDLYGPRDPEVYDAEAYVALARGDCVRSGSCCIQGLCPVAAKDAKDADLPLHGPCPWLVGDEPGSYACQKVLDGDPRMEVVGIGQGCCDPRNMDRLTAGANQTKSRRT